MAFRGLQNSAHIYLRTHSRQSHAGLLQLQEQTQQACYSFTALALAAPSACNVPFPESRWRSSSNPSSLCSASTYAVTLFKITACHPWQLCFSSSIFPHRACHLLNYYKMYLITLLFTVYLPLLERKLHEGTGSSLCLPLYSNRLKCLTHKRGTQQCVKYVF